MESQRSFLVIGLALVSFLLWQQWQKDYGPQPIAPIEQPADQVQQSIPDYTTQTTDSSDVPAGQTGTSNILPSASGQTITINSDVLALNINLSGGDVIAADLLAFPVEQGSDIPYALLSQNGTTYIAQSGLIGPQGPDSSKQGRPLYSAQQSEFELANGENELRVPVIYETDDIKVTKTFVITRAEHNITVEYTVDNKTEQNAQLQQYAQLKQTTAAPENNMFMPTYRGAAYSTADQLYEKYTFEDIEDNNLREVTKGGWVAMLEHYFVSAWVPPQEENNSIYSRLLSNGNAVIGYTGQAVTIPPKSSSTVTSVLYMGPKDQDHLATLAPGLDLTVDYGFLWMISQSLFALLNIIHGLVQNWGVAIIIITVIVKGVMYPLTKKQYESMAKMRNLAPKMQQLKDRFGDDRQKMSQAMMEMYKKEKVNPMGGCFPLLLQMPIFLALYWVLLESVELRHADFALWITDLSVKDPFYVLPILTGASMYLLQKMQPMTMTDPMQQKIMQFMPVFMSIFFLWFPAGLVLYWLVSNIITLVQAKMIYASMEKRGISRT